MRHLRQVSRTSAALLGLLAGTSLIVAPAYGADVTGTVAVGGAATTVTTVTAGQNAMLTMAGTANARVALEFTSFAYNSCLLVTITVPAGTPLKAPSGVCGSSFQEPVTLPTTGTYTILLDPIGSATGSVTVTARTVAPDATGTATVGGAAVAIATTSPAQNAAITFAGTAGQRIALEFSDLTYLECARVSILRPDATVLKTPSAVCAPAFFEPTTLTSTGTHTIVVDPAGNATGSITVKVTNVPANTTGTLTLGGPAVTVTTSSPGQDASLTFAGTAAQRLSVQLTDNTYTGGCAQITVKDPAGGSLIRPTGLCNDAGFFEPVTLATTGTYTVVVNPRGSGTGSVAVRVFNVGADAAATLTPGGAAGTVTTTAPGQNAKFTFTGTAAQRVSVQLSDIAFGSNCLTAKLLNPNATTLTSLGTICKTDAFAEPVTLAATGTYTLVLDPKTTDLGSATGRVFLVAADPAATITVGGAATTITTTAPGQNATVSFAGTAAAKVTLWFTASSLGSAQVTVRKPGGAVLAIKSVDTSAAIKLTLPTTGTYVVTIDPKGGATGATTAAVTV